MANFPRPLTIDSFGVACNQAFEPHDELLVYEERVWLRRELHFLPEDTQLMNLRMETWEIFQRAIKNIFTERRIQALSERYKISFDSQGGRRPLLPNDIVAIGVASGNVHEVDLLESGETVANKTPHEIQQLYLRAQPFHYLGPSKRLPNQMGIPRAPYQFVVVDKLTQDTRRVLFSQGIENLNQHRHSYLQRLTMILISSEPEVGVLIPAPTGIAGSVDYYKVHRIIASKGLYAVALVKASSSSHLKPLLLFRCTRSAVGDHDWGHSWLNNLQEHMGHLGYSSAKNALADLFHNDLLFRREGEKVTIGAYSQGGAYAGYTLRDQWRHVGEAVFFNTVSNSDPKVAEDLAAEINRLPEDQFGPSFFIYRAITKKDRKQGDWAHCLGQKHPGWGISHPRTSVEVQYFLLEDRTFPAEFSFSQMRRWGALHSQRYLDLPGQENPYDRYETMVFRGQRLVDPELDNAQRGEEIRRFEELRLDLGTKILYQVFDIVFQVLDVLFRFLGIRLFRKSRSV